MPKLIHYQNTFTNGEISSLLLARTDLKAYDNALKTMVNAYPMPHGGAKRRPGTIYIGELKAVSEKGRLIPFIYSKSSSYVLVFNGNKIQFIKDGAFITSAGLRYEVDSPYSEDELQDLTFAQSGNALYLAHQNHAPRILKRETDTAWSLNPLSFTYNALTDQWYQNDYIKFKIISGLTPFAVGDTFTITTGAGGNVTSITGPIPVGTNKGVIFGAERTTTAVSQTWTIVCTSADSTSNGTWVVSGSVSGTPTLTWNTGKYPGAVGFFEQRLYFASTPAEPQTVWGSVVGDYTNFTKGPNANDAVEFTFSSNRYDQIVHLESARQLIAMSVGGEFSLVGGTAGITPSSVRIRGNTFHGSSTAKPVRISQEIVFVQRDRKKVRAISYSVAEDTNIATDLTLFAEHITGTGLNDMTFTQDPDYLLWATRDDGVLVSMTHMREQGVTGWARHTTQGFFENCASVPEDDADQTYLIVRRNVNGEETRFIEVLDYTGGVMTDCAMTGTSEVDTAVWNGISHLDGQTVSIVADGVPHADRVVTGGSIELDYPVKNVEIGLGYTTTLEMLHPAAQLPDGTSHARVMSVPRITVRFKETASCKVNGYQLPFRNSLVPFGQPTPPFTGDKEIQLLGWNAPVSIKIEQTEPSPLTVLGVAMKLVIPELTD